ncbi:hypothetical protein EVJ58_g7664 [Rhodofomes roseus]|uniref:Uncharacterized protein n=1 Tax=Rhodofomes roseus TaxID=34475 RepID=A0A4Y9Y6H0_9APHY|nr:hypothetical protein EVJ58_g7664 [Rhodofomes roseus]
MDTSVADEGVLLEDDAQVLGAAEADADTSESNEPESRAEQYADEEFERDIKIRFKRPTYTKYEHYQP